MHGSAGPLNFAKLHGAGNDFLVFDGRADASLEDRLPTLVPSLCDRRLGLGADGVLLLVPLSEGEVRLVYWNADGSEAAFCGNGTRCAARFAAVRWHWKEMVLRTGFAPIPATVAGDQVTLSLPAPSLVHSVRDLGAGGLRVRAWYLVLGVPHLIVKVPWTDFWKHALAPLAPELRRHQQLPHGGANVTFVRPQEDGELWARSWERGVEGETLSCGSGAVASALVALAEGWSAAPVAVRTASGRILRVDPDGDPPSSPSRFTGPAEWVANGSVHAEFLGGM